MPIEILTLVAKSLIDRGLKNIHAVFSDILKENKLKIANPKDIENATLRHLDYVINWCYDISFKELRSSKNLNDIFINININLTPKNLLLENETPKQLNFKALTSNIDRHLVILGDPGAGKTTCLKKICSTALIDEQAIDESLGMFPVLIELRQLVKRENSNLFSFVADELNMKFSDFNGVVAEMRGNTIGILMQYLDELNAIILVDGLDEIGSFIEEEAIMYDITKLTSGLTKAKVVLTSRSGNYKYHIQNSVVYELCSFNKSQIVEFSNKWLINKRKAGDFLNQLYVSPYMDASIRPLTLSHLCAIFERVGNLPEKPKSVYKRIVNLLLEEWDAQRVVKRKSGYINFEIDRKFEFLCAIAFYFTERKKARFDERDLMGAYTTIYQDFGLPYKDMTNVIKEIETHTGIIVESQYKTFEFAHKSTQEYLCAEYLVRLPVNSFKYTSECAVAVSLSPKPSKYLSSIIINEIIPLIDKNDFSFKSVNSFFERLRIEHVDFSPLEEFGVQLILLYNKLYTAIAKNTVEPSIVEIPVNFERFLFDDNIKKSSISILNYYLVDFNDRLISDGHKIIILRRTRTTLPFPQKLPEILICKKGFIF